MKLPLDLYGTDEQAALGAWVLLEANIAPPQLAPAADPNPRAMSTSGRLLSANVRHTGSVPKDACVGCFTTVHMIRYLCTVQHGNW